MIIECPECGTKNSTNKPIVLGKRYRCGKCGAAISYQGDNINNRAADYPTTDRNSAANVVRRTASYSTMGGKSIASGTNSVIGEQTRYRTNYDWSFSDTFKPNGRFSRYQYVFYSIIIPLPMGILFGFFGDKLPFLLYLLALPLLILLAIMAIISGIRRFHDIGRSGWWYLLFFVPLGNIILSLYLIIVPGKPERNRWG